MDFDNSILSLLYSTILCAQKKFISDFVNVTNTKRDCQFCNVCKGIAKLKVPPDSATF